MNSSKKRMFIVEDSDLAEMYGDIFGDSFQTVIAKNGEEALHLARGSEQFDIAIIDMIMPVEDESLALEDQAETGLRVMNFLIAEKKCSRFLVITVRWDTEDLLRQRMRDRADYTVLLKSETDRDEIVKSVDRLLG